MTWTESAMQAMTTPMRTTAKVPHTPNKIVLVPDPDIAPLSHRAAAQQEAALGVLSESEFIPLINNFCVCIGVRLKLMEGNSM